MKNNSSTITNSKVLVTGGAGFIGSNLCKALLEQNNQVICLDNFSTGHRHNIEPLFSNTQFKLIEGDIRNFDDCEKAVEGVDYVLHQAAIGSVPRSIVDPMLTTSVNIGGFVNMLHASVQAKVKRFVYAASSSTYGDQPDLPKKEHIIGNSLSPYAITKYVDELFAQNFSDIYGIETVGLRYFNVFGRHQDPEGAYAAVIPKFVKILISNQSPVVNGDGSFSRDFTYIDNVIMANQCAAVRDSSKVKSLAKEFYERNGIANTEKETLSEVFNVAFGERTTLLELINYLKENLQEFDPKISNLQVEHGPNRRGDIPHSLASIEKGKALFGYTPQFSVKEGLSLATQWYWENLK